MTFNDTSSLASHLATRRSARPRDLIAPGPDNEEIRRIVEIASRTPDHGKLAPWRVVHILPEQRAMLAQHLRDAYRAENPGAGRIELEAMDLFAGHAPQMLAVLSSPKDSSKIPLWEQQMSAGAFAMNLLHAVHASGYAGGWVTGWPAYSAAVRDLLGEPHETIVGFIYVGTPGAPLEERPRPHTNTILSIWQPPTR